LGHAPSRLADRQPGRGTAPELAVLCGSLTAHSPPAASAYSFGLPLATDNDAAPLIFAACRDMRIGAYLCEAQCPLFGIMWVIFVKLIRWI
jgi:hypothetical protein